MPSRNAKTNGTTHDSYLFGISCPSATSCTAVGYWSTNTVQKTLIETWNGTAWSVVPSPNSMTFDALYGVSCLSASACTAVGSSFNTLPRYRTLIETWNGKAWSVIPSPSPRVGYGLLNAVSCVSASDCTAVGDHGALLSCPPQTLAETWNGAKWSVVPSPSRAGKNGLDGVSCTAADNCTAVGSSAPSGNAFETLVESWNGTKWSIVPSPAVGGGNPSSVLNSVWCASAATCLAAGWRNPVTGQNPYRTLVERGTSSGS